MPNYIPNELSTYLPRKKREMLENESRLNAEKARLKKREEEVERKRDDIDWENYRLF